MQISVHTKPCPPEPRRDADLYAQPLTTDETQWRKSRSQSAPANNTNRTGGLSNSASLGKRDQLNQESEDVAPGWNRHCAIQTLLSRNEEHKSIQTLCDAKQLRGEVPPCQRDSPADHFKHRGRERGRETDRDRQNERERENKIEITVHRMRMFKQKACF